MKSALSALRSRPSTAPTRSSWRASTAPTGGSTDYEARGGYAGAAGRSSPRRSRPTRSIAEVKKSALRGRGGAGFPTGLKWSFMPQELPGAEVRRLQFRRGRAGHVQGPRHPALQPAHRDRGHGDRRLRDGLRPRLQLHPRRDLGRLRALRGGARGGLRRRATSARTSWARGFDFDLYDHHGYGAYICGEETALLESLEGKKGQPRFKPPFPASYGLYGKPTTINNTETFAAVPWIITQRRRGVPRARPAEQRRHQALLGLRATSSGPATTRCKLGTPFAKLLEMAGGMRGGRKLKAVHSRAARRCRCCRATS